MFSGYGQLRRSPPQALAGARRAPKVKREPILTGDKPLLDIYTGSRKKKMKNKRNQKSPLLDPCGNIIEDEMAPTLVFDLDFTPLLKEEEAMTNGRRAYGEMSEHHISTSGGRVVPTHVVRGFSKPAEQFDFLFAEEGKEYVNGFYPTLELTSGVEVQVGDFCRSFVESEGVITEVLEEVRRKASTY